MKKLDKKLQAGVLLAALLLSVSITAPAGAALFNDIITLSGGSQAERSFYLYKPFDVRDLSGAKLYLVIVSGGAETLTVDFSIDPELDLGEKVYFSLIGAAVNQEDGLVPVSARAETPFSALSTIPVHGEAGVVLIGAMITGSDGRIEWPIEGSITFTLDSEADVHTDDDALGDSDQTPDDHDH